MFVVKNWLLENFSKPNGLLSSLLESDFGDVVSAVIDGSPEASIEELRSHISDEVSNAPDGYFTSMIDPETFPEHVKQAYDRLDIDKKVVDDGHVMYQDEIEAAVYEAVIDAINNGAYDAEIQRLKNITWS